MRRLPRSLLPILRIGALATTLLAARPALAQFPVVTKILKVESNPATLTATDAAARSAKTPLSNHCRTQAQAPENADVQSFGCWWAFLNLRTSAQADEYFGDLEVGGALALTQGEKTSTLYSELLSDNLWLAGLLGYGRLGLSMQIVASEPAREAEPNGVTDQARDASVDQLFQGGGNALLHFTMPLAVWINFIRDEGAISAPVRRFDSAWFLATGFDIPALNGPINRRSGSLRTGLQSYFTWRTFNADFKFFAQTSAAYVLGFNEDFYAELVGAELQRPRRGLGLVRGTFGVEVGNVASVGASIGTTSISGVRQPVRLTIQLLDRKVNVPAETK